MLDAIAKAEIDARTRVHGVCESEADARYNWIMLMAMVAELSGAYDDPAVAADETPEQSAVRAQFRDAAIAEMKLSRNNLVRYLLARARIEGVLTTYTAGQMGDQEAVAAMNAIEA